MPHCSTAWSSKWFDIIPRTGIVFCYARKYVQMCCRQNIVAGHVHMADRVISLPVVAIRGAIIQSWCCTCFVGKWWQLRGQPKVPQQFCRNPLFWYFRCGLALTKAARTDGVVGVRPPWWSAVVLSSIRNALSTCHRMVAMCPGWNEHPREFSHVLSCALYLSGSDKVCYQFLRIICGNRYFCTHQGLSGLTILDFVFGGAESGVKPRLHFFSVSDSTP